MYIQTKLFVLAISVIILVNNTGCNKQPAIDEEVMLDGDNIYDPSITDSAKYLVSAAIPDPSQLQKETPVVIAVHGYSATTFEWDEFRQWSDSIGKYYVSQVLLGGHGRDYEAFKKATWQDWQQPIIDEYKKLDAKGFQKISLIGSSTGCPLILNLVYSGKISICRNPKHILFIDPIIIPSNKSLTLVDFVGPAIGYAKANLDSGEQGHWYQYRPQESLNQLLDIITLVRKKLEDGITLPQNTTLKVYKAEKDNSADPISAVLLYKGVKNSNGSHISVEMVNSSLHVFTRLKGRNIVTSKDKVLQIKTFEDIASIIEN